MAYWTVDSRPTEMWSSFGGFVENAPEEIGVQLPGTPCPPPAFAMMTAEFSGVVIEEVQQQRRDQKTLKGFINQPIDVRRMPGYQPLRAEAFIIRSELTYMDE